MLTQMLTVLAGYVAKSDAGYNSKNLGKQRTMWSKLLLWLLCTEKSGMTIQTLGSVLDVRSLCTGPQATS